jgi:hypothetical protein
MRRANKKDRKNNGFTKAPNGFMWDETLSLEEKALLILIASNAKDWKIHITEIYSRSNNSPASQRKVVKGLMGKGHLKRIDGRGGNNQKFGYEYQYSFTGGLCVPDEKPCDGFPDTETPKTESPNVGTPKVEIPATETADTNNTKLNNTKMNNIKQKEIIRTERSESKEIPELQEEKKQGFVAPTQQEAKQYFESIGSDAAAAFSFFTEFNERNWSTTKGERVHDWKAMARFQIRANPERKDKPEKGVVKKEVAPSVKTKPEIGNQEQTSMNKGVTHSIPFVPMNVESERTNSTAYLNLPEKDRIAITKVGQHVFSEMKVLFNCVHSIEQYPPLINFTVEDITPHIFKAYVENQFTSTDELYRFVNPHRGVDYRSVEYLKSTLELKTEHLRATLKQNQSEERKERDCSIEAEELISSGKRAALPAKGEDELPF